VQSNNERTIKALGVQITGLWDRLKVDEEARDLWLSQHTGAGQAVIDAVRCGVFATCGCLFNVSFA